MRKRVIKSLVFGALSVMVISFLVLTPVFFFTFQHNATEDMYIEMQDNIGHIKPLAQMSLNFRTSKMDRLFNESMSQFSYFSKSNIFLIDTSGNPIWANGVMAPDKIKAYSIKALDAIKNEGTIKTRGLLDGLYSCKTVTVGEYVKNDFDKNSWIIFCSKKAPDLSGQFKGVFLEILLIELITLCFVSVFMFLFSRNITVPLNKINNTLKEFAKGKFDKRVEYNADNEIGELATNINQMAESINSLEQMRQDFVSDISHELRTPLTSISGFVEGVLDGTIPKGEHDKYLKIVLSETKRISRLVNELLNLTTIDEQIKNLTPSDFDIEELSKIVLLKFEDDIVSKNISVNFELEGDEFIVKGDKDKYIQVLINLIHNAVKFTPADGNINLSLKKTSDKCVFSITNSGDGIDEDKLRFIWERFYKADNSRSKDKSGVGIGLYIVKKILDAHDEKITVSSVKNESTTFSFTIALS